MSKIVSCGVPLGYHEEEQELEWCNKKAVTGICDEHWKEMIQLHSELDRLKTALTDAIDLAAEGISYTSPYFVKKWEMDTRLAELKEIASHPTPESKS
jgi:hypothetical protein